MIAEDLYSALVVVVMPTTFVAPLAEGALDRTMRRDRICEGPSSSRFERPALEIHVLIFVARNSAA